MVNRLLPVHDVKSVIKLVRSFIGIRTMTLDLVTRGSVLVQSFELALVLLLRATLRPMMQRARENDDLIKLSQPSKSTARSN